MKKITLSIALLFFSALAFSQGLPVFQLGVKGGMNLSKFKTENTFESENKAGYYGGLWVRIGAAGIHVQPEVYLSGKTSKLRTTTGSENEVTFTSLDIPILIGTKIGAGGVGLRLNTGPVFTLFLDEEQKFGQAAGAAFDGKFKDKSVSWQFGVGLDLGRISVDGRYESGLSEINSAAGYPTTKLNLYTLGIGLRLF